MKKIFICVIIFTSLISKSFAGDPPLFGIALIASKNDIMYMKFDPELVGAKIEIFNHEGNLIARHFLKKHYKGKLIIDFIEAVPGNYTVVVIKNNKFRAFHYTQTDLDNSLLTSSVNRVKFYEKTSAFF